MKKENKLIILISILSVVFIIFLILVFRPYEYKHQYFINKYKIEEQYNTKDKFYTFTISNEEEKYIYIIKNRYYRKRELIQSIQISKSDNEICILPQSTKIDLYPLCKRENNILTYNISDNRDLNFKYNKVKLQSEQYKNIKINNLNGHSFLIYNYKGFYLINEREKKEIKLFDKDIYNLSLVYQKDNFIILPDYNQNYYFNKLFIVNILNGKVKELQFDYHISYEAEFLGDYKNFVYLLDKKEEKEYRIDIKKSKIKSVDFQILKDNKLIKTDFKKVKKFYINNIFTYKIIDNKIYQTIDDYKIKISNLDINQIIKIHEANVYYLSNKNLYKYNNKDGEILLLSNFEWNFNNTNVIYLYK